MNSLNLNIKNDYRYQVGAWCDDYIMFKSENNQLETISREESKFVICEICGKEFEMISPTHLKKHNLTTKEYKEVFPEAKLSSKVRNQKITEGQTGAIFTESRKDNIRKALTGKKKSEEHRLKIKETVNTPERKELNKNNLIRLKAEGKGWYSKESREKAMIEKRKNGNLFLEGDLNVAKRQSVRKKISESKIEFWSDEENVKQRIKTWRKNLSDGKFKMSFLPYYNVGGGRKEDLGFYVRSRIEANIIRVLNLINVEHEYEPKSYLLYDEKGEIIDTYLPDLYIKDKDLFIEIKPADKLEGMLDKVIMFSEQVSKISVIDRYFYDLISFNYSRYIDTWEYRNNGFEIALRDYDQGKLERLEDIVRTLQRCKERSRNDYADYILEIFNIN